ncbi:MAG: cbb3-type cytochrome c oxidase subunit 3 [Polymorphobacter sp.]|uniref:cbb3-type cytochrome c oxidase subunit 3 n=1 Tax=Polymorphobacter sp. TaxID=1909290 RepID=UPI003A88B73A
MSPVETYDALRHFADSWGLVMLGLIFLGLVGWTFRKGAGAEMDRAANSIFEDDQDTGHGQ